MEGMQGLVLRGAGSRTLVCSDLQWGLREHAPVSVLLLLLAMLCILLQMAPKTMGLQALLAAVGAAVLPKLQLPPITHLIC